MKKIKDLQEIIEISINHNGENKIYPCNVQIKEEGKRYQAHEVSIAHRDLLFFCDKGTVNYDVNTIGFNNYLSLVSIDE